MYTSGLFGGCPAQNYIVLKRATLAQKLVVGRNVYTARGVLPPPTPPPAAKGVDLAESSHTMAGIDRISG